MSGICDTCKRNQDCRKPLDGMDYCRLYVSGKESNYSKLFGTPERAAETLVRTSDERAVCKLPTWTASSNDYEAWLDWLRGDAE